MGARHLGYGVEEVDADIAADGAREDGLDLVFTAAPLYRCSERVSGEFDRTLTIPVQIDPDGIKAEYHDGVLALFLPRAESDKPRSIKVE